MTDFIIEKWLATRAARVGNLVEWMRPRIDPSKKRVLLAAAPKSGSTYLTKLLGAVLGWKTRDAVASYGSSEQQIYLPRLTSAMREDTLIGHQHLRANEMTLKVLRLFQFKTVVLVRDFPDSAVSMRDHHLKESTTHPMAAVSDQQIRQFTRSQHLWFVIRMIMPWYFNFYISWKRASLRTELPIYWLNYKDLVGNTHCTLARLLRFIGVRRTREQIENAIELTRQEGGIRKNVGIHGRGQAELSPAQLNALNEMTTFYPDVDFSTVGLGGPEENIHEAS